MKYDARLSINWQSNICETEAEREAFCQMNNIDKGVHQHDDGLWWFYDETQTDEYGGYVTKEEAIAGLDRYAAWLSGPTTV